MDADFIIVGQGIAGTLLCEALLSYGQKVLVVDNFQKNASSVVAAGLFNPIVFKRYVESWKADDLLSKCDLVYPKLEGQLRSSFYHKREIHKIFSNENEKELWIKKCSSSPFMQNEPLAEYLEELIENKYGSGKVLNGGFLEVNKFLKAYKEHLKNLNLLLEDDIDHSQVKHYPTYITWKELTAKKIIYCGGAIAQKDPFFKWLPFKLTKGEVLTIKADTLDLQQVINKGVFVLPVDKNRYKIGATYEWDNLNYETTEQAQMELSCKLKNLLKIPFEILEQTAGIRPTTLDRRPFIGMHPKLSNIGIFNGLGTKGVMIAPYYAEQFAKHLLFQNEIDPEVNINRYSNLFMKSENPV